MHNPLLAGVWTYRSFINEPKQVDDFNLIRWGQGELSFSETSDPGTVRGLLAFRSAPPKPDDPKLVLTGSGPSGNSHTIRLQGKGVANSVAAGWVYDYVGYLIPAWPDGVNQAPTVVGSVIRTVAHNGRPAGVVGSFIAVRHAFLEPRDVIPLPVTVREMLAGKDHRLHHAVWHGARNSWLALPDAKRQAIRDLGWAPGGIAERASLQSGVPLVRNGSGEDFLYMHRQMIRMVNAKGAETGLPPVPAWPSLPPPSAAVVEPNFNGPAPVVPPAGNPDGYAVPPAWVDPDDETTNRRIAWLKQDGHYWSRMRWWEREFRNPVYLSQLTLGELGALLEFSVHNDLHMRWASLPRDPRTGQPVPGGREVNDVRDFWDDPAYDFLGEFYSSHVHPVFWRLHGWIDQRIQDWFNAHEAAHAGEIQQAVVGEVPWFAPGRWVQVSAPWSGPEHAGHGHGHGHGGMPDLNVETMKQVNAILFGASPAERPADGAATHEAPAALPVARRSDKPHWF